MSWFQNLTGALSGGSSNAGASNSNSSNSGNSNTSVGGNSSGNSSNGGAEVYDVAGNPVSSSANTQSESRQQTPIQGAPVAKTPTIEELLFSPPEPAPNNQQPNNQQNQQNQQQSNQPGSVELAPGLTQQQLIQNLQSVDFMRTIPQETVQSALGGDAAAFGQVMTQVAQIASAIAIQQSLVSNKAMLDKRFTEFDGTVANKIGEAKYADIFVDPKFSNPFVRPMAENLVTRLRERDPSITPDQIKQVLPNLIEHAMKQFQMDTPSPQQQPSRQQPMNRPTDVKFDELFS